MVRTLEGKHPKYYEAILQLREVTQEVVDFIEEELAKGRMIISKVEDVRNGIDYYLSDNDLTKALGKKLQIKFGGELKLTASLHTKKDSKDLYRVTVLFRQAHFRKGDKVDYQGDVYDVKSVSKEILLQHDKTGKKVHIKYKEMNQIKKVA
ncbi:hypothetical protein COV20_02700 [Candidatus Woesearchaeota archaeon CG10_big_fil_rev_8_21_14_0_10_45_16]|nr:MAG: hypothetical protein COV20_02700 [Candidatus Woesearchaeota archaeon CG10_big_fil_rev_8_21_14_0_10_45_16]